VVEMTAKDQDHTGRSEIANREDLDLPRVRSPDPYPIAIGLCIIGSMYLFPFFPAPAPSTGSFTLADIAVGGYAGLFPWNPMLLLTFILGWGASIALITQGLLSTKPDLSFGKP